MLTDGRCDKILFSNRAIFENAHFKDKVKTVVGSEVRKTKLSTIYSLYHQEKEETDAPPSKLKMVKVESEDVADEVEKDVGVKVRVEKEKELRWERR